ncbi:MAG: zinc ribbon domain-containing protein [Pseudomonadota bacterium]
MPTYDYLCEANSRKVEVSHKMAEKILSWGELCDRAHIAPGDTPLDAPVRKLLSAGAVIGSSSLKNPEPACSTGSCCPGGVCGLPG